MRSFLRFIDTETNSPLRLEKLDISLETIVKLNLKLFYSRGGEESGYFNSRKGPEENKKGQRYNDCVILIPEQKQER